MSQRQRTGYLNIQLRDETDQQVWEQAEQAVAQTLGVETDDLSRATVARELAESYIGKDGLGQWRNGDSNE